jgi:hypothetical protein
MEADKEVEEALMTDVEEVRLPLREQRLAWGK